MKKQDQCLRLVNVSKTFGDLKAVNTNNKNYLKNKVNNHKSKKCNSSPIKVFKQSIVKLKIPINAKFILNISGPEWIPKIRVNSEYNKTWIDAKTKSPKSEIK